ncbi:MAG: DUF11 domain-containing protein [Gemmataceae bacterium]|nr:DUF11 domain-containing protein [Gemmataceae bacterium]
MELRITGPSTSTVGDKVSYEARVVNAGQLPAHQVKLHAELDPGLDHPSAGREVELSLGTIGPGEVKTLNVSALVKSAGRLRSLARVSADGAETVSQDVYIDARGARIQGEMSGPQKLLVGETGSWTVKITNKGNAPATRVVARLPLPSNLKVDRIDEGGTVSGGIASWKLDSLAPGATRTLTLSGHPVGAIPKSALLATFAADRVAESRADATFEAVGVPRLKLEIHSSDPSVDVGTPVIYTATLRNTGSMPLTGVLFRLDLPENMKPLHGYGATVPKIEDRSIRFNSTSLMPGQVLEFRIEAVGTAPGDARIRATAQCPSLSDPVQQDEATRIQSPAR